MSATGTRVSHRLAAIRAILALGFLATIPGACGGDPDTAKEIPPRGHPLVPDTLAAWLGMEQECVLLDIQPDSLFEAGHLPGAIHAGSLGVESLRGVLPFEPRVPIVVINTDGIRPTPDRDLTVEAMALGYPRVYWLEGGVEGWRRAGHPVDGFRVFPRP